MTGQRMIAIDESIRSDNGRRRRKIHLLMVGGLEARLHRTDLEELADGTRSVQHRPTTSLQRGLPRRVITVMVIRSARLRALVRRAVVLMVVELMARRMHQGM